MSNLALSTLGPAEILRHQMAQLTPNTRRAYDQDLRAFAAWASLGGPEAVARWFAETEVGTANGAVLAFANSLHGKGLAGSTVARRLTGIRSLVSILRTVGLCHYSIGVRAGKSKAPRRATHGPSTAEWGRMLTAAKDAQLRAILLLLHDLGLRRGEVVALNLADLSGSTLEVTRKGQGTSKFARKLSARARAALDAWLEERGDEEGPLFLGVEGQRLNASVLYRWVRNLARSVGLTRTVSPHRIRHTAATALAELSNGNTVMVADFLGHADLSTAQRYVDAVEDRAGKGTALVAGEARS